MKILLIGHSIIDHFDDQSSYAKPGGVYYSTLGFLSFFKPNDHLMLLTGKNSNSFGLFELLYSKVDLSLSEEIVEMPEVYLFTSGNAERREVYKNISANLSFKALRDVSSFDGICINMITGFDITLKQLKWLRKNFVGPIYFDVHTLSRGLEANGKRCFRPIPQIEEWLSCIDILQCNVSELKAICNDQEEKAASWIFDNGVSNLIVTKAENGASHYFKEDGRITNYKINGEKIVLKNKIGCGDVFGAAFFYSYISRSNNRLSLAIANHAGAVAASTTDLFNISRLTI